MEAVLKDCLLYHADSLGRSKDCHKGRLHVGGKSWIDLRFQIGHCPPVFICDHMNPFTGNMNLCADFLCCLDHAAHLGRRRVFQKDISSRAYNTKKVSARHNAVSRDTEFNPVKPMASLYDQDGASNALYHSPCIS